MTDVDGGIDIKQALSALVDRRSLTATEMATVVGQIMDGQATPAQVGALLTALRMKGETVDEVVGAAQAMRQRMRRVDVAAPVLLDTCGTGGDGSGSVNVSTLASFILAACGVKVAKHGNRAMSSRTGGHDVIEALGLDPAPAPDLAARCLQQEGLCFMFAPAYHAATKHAVGPRREIGFRTLFNLLGPLTNPASAKYHVNGVFSASRCEFVAQAHQALGSKRALVVHGAGGLDEIAPSGKTQVAELTADGQVRSFELTPSDFGLPDSDPAGLQGGEPALNARILRETLEGSAEVPAAVRLTAVMTAAAGLYVTGVAADWKTGAAAAAAALESKRALHVLDRLRLLTPAPKTTP